MNQIKKKLTLIFVFFIYVSTYLNIAFSQENTSFTLKGKLTTQNLQNLDNITIQLLKSVDDKLAKLEFVNADGTFIFEKMPKGEYILLIQSLSFKSYKSEIIVLNKDTDLGEIKVEPLDNTLKEVTVTASKPFIQQEYDKTVLNVSNSINAVGNTALEVLAKAPGVSVDQNDNIAMRGKQGVLVMIDGKLVPMSGQDLANTLKGMQSDQIEKIDLITNPSAKYDASGNAGIIDIRLKKGKNNGTNGTVAVNMGQGRYSKLNPSLNLNHRTKNLNIFGSYNFGSNENFNKLDILRDFYGNNNQLTGSNNYNNYFKFNFGSHNTRLGTDVNIGKNVILGFVANGMFTNGKINSNSLAQSLNSASQPSGSFNTVGNNNPLRRNNSFNLNYKHTLDTNGKELTADFDYAFYNSGEIQNYLTNYFDNNNNPSQNPFRLKGDLSGNLNIKSFKIDYQQPIKSIGAKFEAGIKSSWVTSDNDVKFFDQSNGSDVLDVGKSNQFIYNENINAAYVNTLKSWNKLSLQLGLRLENTVADGLQVTDQTTFDRNYVQLFPSGYLGYKFNEKNNFGVSLSRRINRPSYRQLNPFKVFLDPLTYSTGNPFLNPELTKSFEFTYTYDQKYIAKIGYSRTNNNILSVLSPDNEPNSVVQTDRNLAQLDYYNFSLGFPITIGKWLNSNVNGLVFYGNHSGNLVNTNLNDGMVTFNFNTNNSIVINKSLTAEVNAFYNTKSLYGFLDINNIWALSLGVQKQFLDKKASLKFNVNDVLFTNKVNGNTLLTGYGEEFFQTRDSRVGTLSFTYRFGKTQGQRPPRKTGGAEEEKRRAG